MSQRDDASRRTCAICGKPQEPQFRPFCSKRCADIDLGRWLKGSYAILGHETAEGDQSLSNDVE